MQAMQLLLPLLALPLLARRLGPEAFGLLMFFCLLPPLVALLTDWGLAPGGARAAAEARNNNGALSRLLAAVNASRLLLISAVILLALILLPLLPYTAQYPGAYALAIAAGIARGLTPAWFFQGTATATHVIALLDVSTSLCVLLLVFLCVSSPQAWPLYLLFLAICKTFAYGAAYAFIWRRYGLALDFRGALALLKKCSPLSASSFALLFTYNGAQIISGYFLSAADMGILGAVNKMLRALGSIITPFTMTIFPEICIWRQTDAAKARKALRLSLGLTALAATMASAIAIWAAPWLIHIALGPHFAAAVPALRTALLAAPAMACNNVLGQQTMIPFGQDKSLLTVQTAAALLTMPLAATLCHFLELTGGAMLPVCTEYATLAGLAVMTVRKCPEAFTAGNN